MKINLTGKNITIENIVWDTDGTQVKLPNTIVIPATLVGEFIANYLSEETGWCVAEWDASVLG